MKIAICAMCRKENKYILEWLNYHRRLGINHFYLFDNNDENDEKLSDVVNAVDVTIYDVHGRTALIAAGNQTGCYTKCYNEHKHEYDWFGFLDIDEFLTIVRQSLPEFLSNNCFVDTDVIHFSWQIYGDCGHTFYEDKPVQERFPRPLPIDAIYAQKFPENCWVKSFVKCGNKRTVIQCHTAYVENGICKTADGVLSNCNKLQEQVISWNNAFVKHYITKSFQEHIERRILHLGNAYDNNNTTISLQLRCYFNVNDYSKEKIELLKKTYDTLKAD